MTPSPSRRSRAPTGKTSGALPAPAPRRRSRSRRLRRATVPVDLAEPLATSSATFANTSAGERLLGDERRHAPQRGLLVASRSALARDSALAIAVAISSVNCARRDSVSGGRRSSCVAPASWRPRGGPPPGWASPPRSGWPPRAPAPPSGQLPGHVVVDGPAARSGTRARSCCRPAIEHESRWAGDRRLDPELATTIALRSSSYRSILISSLCQAGGRSPPRQR